MTLPTISLFVDMHLLASVLSDWDLPWSREYMVEHYMPQLPNGEALVWTR